MYDLSPSNSLLEGERTQSQFDSLVIDVFNVGKDIHHSFKVNTH